MVAMQDADGTVIGAGGIGRHTCNRSARDRRGFGCDAKGGLLCTRGQGDRDRLGCDTKNTWIDDFTKQEGNQTMMTSRDMQIVNSSLRRHGLKLGADGVAVPLQGYKENAGGGNVDPDKLRAVLSELGILDDDVEMLIARLNEPDGVDAAPSDMGAYSGVQGGGVMRSYVPDDPSPDAGATNELYNSGAESQVGKDARRGRRMAGDAAAEDAAYVARTMATRRQRYNAGQISLRDLQAPITTPRQLAADAKAAKDFDKTFPDATRLGHTAWR